MAFPTNRGTPNFIMNLSKTLTLSATGVVSDDAITLSIEDIGDIPVSDLFANFANEEVKVTIKSVTDEV